MKLFEPATLGELTLHNRVGVPAMCTYMVTSNDGVGDLRHIAHYATLAKGQPAFIVQEATAINANAFIDANCLGIYTPRQRQVLKQIVDVVHSYHVKIGIQLNHAGFKNRFGNQKYGPMDQQDVKGLTKEEIHEILINFSFASKWAREMGYDFVEIHGAHGYLINQFLSPLTNQREDAYGKDRTLFLRQVIASCKEGFERDVIVRISAEEYEENGLHIDDMKPIVQCIEDAGASAISVSSGGLNKRSIKSFPMYQIPFAKSIRAYSKLPIMGVGCITKTCEIEQILNDESCDFVLVGRKMVRDPNFLLCYQDQLGLLQEEQVGECMYRAIHID